MDSPILVNQVIHFVEKNLDFRVLWNVDPGFWICLTTRSNIPVRFSLPEIISGIENGNYTFIPDLWLAGGTMHQPSEAAIRNRERIWNLIRDVVCNEPDIFDSVKRSAMLKEVSKVSGIAVPNLYPYLGRYWRGGKVPDALLPEFYSRGKSRDLFKDSAQRVGRKKQDGKPGKKLSNEDLINFQDALMKYHLHGEKLSLEKTYNRLLKDHYTVKDGNGKTISFLSPDELPSPQQFFYWHWKNKNILEEAKALEGENKYALKNRAVLERTETHLYGPGVASQIDATIADIHLVSQDDRTAIIGRPTLYFLIDSFSHMVLGMNVSLDPPSLENAFQTILNAVESKVDYCRKYGVEISEEEWPCHHIPSIILGDRGEMESKGANKLVAHLGISIETAPPYRGDLKGIVEKYFHLTHLNLAGLPGYIKKDAGQRCAHDYRLDAALDVRQFTAIVIRCVLRYNNYHYMKDYRKTPQMRQLQVKPVPRELWNYGIRYLSGGLRTMDRKYVRYHLLPKGQATVTREGIRFNDKYYTCEQAEQEKWFDIARTQHRWKVTCAYDPRDAALIYLSPAAGADPVECHLLQKDWMYGHLSAEESFVLAEADKAELAAYELTEKLESVKLDECIQEIRANAARAATGSENRSKAQRIASIQANRKKEKKDIVARNTEVTLQENGIPAPKEVKEESDEMTPVQKMIRDALNKALKEEEPET